MKTPSLLQWRRSIRGWKCGSARSPRPNGRIFSTAPRDGTQLRVMLDEADIDAAIAATAGAQELWWGKQRAGVQISLAEAEHREVRDLLERAWRRRAGR